MKPKTIVSLVIALLFVIILFQNSESPTLRLFFWETKMPLFVLIIMSLLIGATLGWFGHMNYRRKRTQEKEEPSISEIESGGMETGEEK